MLIIRRAPSVDLRNQLLHIDLGKIRRIDDDLLLAADKSIKAARVNAACVLLKRNDVCPQLLVGMNRFLRVAVVDDMPAMPGWAEISLKKPPVDRFVIAGQRDGQRGAAE